ncbi:MAG TPA: lipoprotein signal peptidase [Flavisolibacter sp.]|nr:lipoprotein signal peptidase [Flavisolibacter sp.]
MKLRSAILIIAVIIIVDQALKIWIKTSYPLGEVMKVFGSGEGRDFNGFKLYFVENPGMAWGMRFWGENGKLVLTIFRLLAVIFGTWYLGRIIRQQYSRGFVICASLIYAGALGNLIDSMFYGLIFDKGMTFNASLNDYVDYAGIAQFSGNGYNSFLYGNVVDMLYFPIIRSSFPDWLPWVGGKEFEFFSPIFNIADASISIGVITLLLFQKRLVRKHEPDSPPQTVTTSTEQSDRAEVM